MVVSNREHILRICETALITRIKLKQNLEHSQRNQQTSNLQKQKYSSLRKANLPIPPLSRLVATGKLLTVFSALNGDLSVLPKALCE